MKKLAFGVLLALLLGGCSINTKPGEGLRLDVLGTYTGVLNARVGGIRTVDVTAVVSESDGHYFTRVLVGLDSISMPCTASTNRLDCEFITSDLQHAWRGSFTGSQWSGAFVLNDNRQGSIGLAGDFAVTRH